jgi:hypothetical protein
MEPERRPVALISSNGDLIAGEFSLWEESPVGADRVRLAISFGGTEIVREADDFFAALLAIRMELEALDLIPICYGSSRNVYPSGMSQGMGLGDKAFKLYPGRRGRMADVVGIFDSGPDIDPVPVHIQAASYQEWLRSIGS